MPTPAYWRGFSTALKMSFQRGCSPMKTITQGATKLISGQELFTFDNMAGKKIGVIAGTTNARAVRDQLARRNLSATLVEFRDRREGIAALARGDLDGFASDKFVLLALARAESLRDFMLLPDDL